MIVEVGNIDGLAVVFYYESANNQLFLQLRNSNKEVVEALVAEGDPHYRVNAHFKGNVDDWLDQEFIPECNKALESYFGKDIAPDMGDITARIQWNLQSNMTLNEDGQIAYRKPQE